MKEREFKYGDKVRILCPGMYRGREGMVVGVRDDGSIYEGLYVDLNYDTPEPHTEIFAAEHLKLIEPAEEKPSEIKDLGDHPYREAVEKLLERQEKKGVSKYGVTLDKNDTLTTEQRIEHLEEELIDALMYCEHLKAVNVGSGLTADDYQRAALRTAQADLLSLDDLSLNGAMGLCGEAGECIDILKKVRFQGHRLDFDALKKELGDVAWYLAVASYGAGFRLSEVFETNIEKLKERYPDGFDKARSINRKEYKSEEGNSPKVSDDVSD